MSLYCFGKIKLTTESAEPFSFPAGTTIRRSVDPGDAEEIETIGKLVGDGIYFTVCDDSNSVDATRLWLEMMNTGPDRAIETRLGGTVHTLFFHPHILIGAIAFVDGGIGAILEGTPEQCWMWLLERAGKPWDTIDNPMLIWTRPTQRGGCRC